MKDLKGSLTVEASILLPFIMFIIAAQIFMIFFMHDSVILQSNGYRTAEGVLWERSDNNQLPLYRMEIGDCTVKKKTIATEIRDIMDCRESVIVRMAGSISMDNGYIRSLIGNSVTKKYESNMTRICYIEDRIRSVMVQRMQENKS